METPKCLFHSWSHFHHPHWTVTLSMYPLIPARAGLTIMCLWNMHQEFPGRDPSSERPVRVLAPTARLLSMKVLLSSPLLRVSIAPPLSLHPSLSLSLSHTHSLSHCIHFCAFKKSPRITNLAESELNGVTEDYKRKQNKDGPGTRWGPPRFYFFYFFKNIIPACE